MENMGIYTGFIIYEHAHTKGDTKTAGSSLSGGKYDLGIYHVLKE